LKNDTLARVPCTTNLSADASETLAAHSSKTLAAHTPETLAAVRMLEAIVGSAEQIEVTTEHLLHGGMYSRTIRIPADSVITGAYIKVPTVLIVHGDADVLTGDRWVSLSGYGVLAGSAFRKQVFVTRSAVEMTMVFATQAKTVEEAERELTDEYDMLMSHNSVRDEISITGE